MSSQMSQAQLSSCSDADFDKNVKNLSVKDLMGLISYLQKEMSKEQENFNSLSAALKGLKDRKSRQHKTISADMVKIQGRLNTLMNRSMKCFSQLKDQDFQPKQNTQQQNNNSQDVQLRRLNSSRATASPNAATVQRSRSMHTVTLPSSDKDESPSTPSSHPPSVQSPTAAATTGVTRTHSSRVEGQRRPASVAGMNGVVSESIKAAPAVGSRVNGVPAMTTAAQGGRIQGQFVKRNAAPKPPASTAATVGNGPTELEKVHARLQSSRELNLSSLPDKPAAPKGVNNSSAQQNGEREVSVFKTNLDRKKSSSSIVLGQKSDFEDGTPYNALSVARPAHEPQMAPLRKAQSREELYVIESRARVQKDALLKEIGNRKKSEEDEAMANVSVGQWGLKGTSILAQRLEQDQKQRAETSSSSSSSNTTTQNGEPRSSKPPPSSSSSSSSSSTTPWGKENGGMGLAVRIRSTSRENLAESQPEQKLSIKPADNRKSSQPSSSSSSSRTQPISNKAETAATPLSKPPPVSAAAAQKQGTPGQSVAATTTAKADMKGEGDDDDDDDDDLVDMGGPRMNLINWDPKPVLNQLYSIKLMEETAEDISHQFVSMEGLMEKLPMNKKKSTLLKTWKRRFFRAKDGWLQYFETGSRDKPSETLQLMGGHIDDMGNRILGIDDGRGHYLMVRAPTDKEHGQWKVALESQTADNTKATYVRPILSSPPHSSKHIVVIDMGSGAIRAGILGEKECLPQVFFPSVVAVDKDTGKKVVGMEAYHPDVRRNSTILHPIRPSNRVDKEGVMKKFKIDVDMMAAVFGKVFSELGVNPKKYMVMLSTPQILSDSLRSGLMEALVGSLGVEGVCMVQQSLLALYSYHATTGIIVDIGQRLEILPIYDGFVIEGGVSRCSYGSQKVLDSLKKALLETNFKFASEVELLLVQHIMQECCYVAYNYKDEETLCMTQPGKLKRTVNLEKFDLPEGAYRDVEVEEGRFSSPEGFFNVDLWEMDYPTLHKLIFQAIQSCPMDSRRHMYRAVYLSGGVTMLPGFQERLETELRKLAPPAVLVEVHAAPNRYHAAYLGACSVASMPQFKDMAISREEWSSQGVKAFRKWQTPAA